jgi:hypothetical protein
MEHVNATDRGILTFYIGLARTGGLECPFTEGQAVNGEADKWMGKVDASVTPTDLRRFLQADETNADEITLGALAQRYRRLKANDKLFITVAEYLYRFSPAWFQELPAVSMAEVADVLEPVLGPAGELPEWLPRMEELINELVAYEHLHELAQLGIFDRGRHLKAKVSAKGVDSMGLVAFARFNYVLRNTFTTLWDAELWWIEQALNELESRADFFVDCTEIGLSPIVPTNELFRMVCEWKRPAFTDYAQDLTYQRVQKVRQILETALLPEPV